jgi:hypothetical protein
VLAFDESQWRPDGHRAWPDDKTAAQSRRQRVRRSFGHGGRCFPRGDDPERIGFGRVAIACDRAPDQRSRVDRTNGGLGDGQEIVSKAGGRMCQ